VEDGQRRCVSRWPHSAGESDFFVKYGIFFDFFGIFENSGYSWYLPPVWLFVKSGNFYFCGNAHVHGIFVRLGYSRAVNAIVDRAGDKSGDEAALLQ